MSEQLPVPLQASGSSFRQSDGIRMAPGTWWRTKRAFGKGADALPEGTYVLVDNVEMADGSPHTMHVAEPPSAVQDDRLGSKHYERGWRVLAEGFLDIFEPVAEAEAMAARQKEIDAVQGRISGMQQDTQAATADLMLLASAAGSAPSLLSAPDAQDAEATESSGSALVRQDTAARAVENMAERARSINAVSKRITANAVAIGNATSRVSLYYAERSKAALAAVQPALAVAGRLMEHVGTMSLYIGKDVEATLLLDGASAPASEKLTLLQRRLFLDEELLVHLEDGGADYEDVASLGQALERDPALVERIFGAQRAVVSMAARRKAKDYNAGIVPSAGQIIKAFFANEANKASFLLVRDGQRVWLVDLPQSMQGLERLFPTPEDLEAPYTERSWFSRDKESVRIGPQSLDYAKATEEFRKLAVHYERVLILLWGLHDRLGLFGPFAEGGGYAGFGDPRLQQERFRLIFDDQSLLGRDYPPYHKWLASKNACLRSGSRVAVVWKRAMTAESAPGAVETDRRRDSWRDVFKYQPVDKQAVVIVRREGESMVVDAPVQREVYDKDAFDYRMRRMNARVDLSKLESGREFALLVLDDVDPDDIDHYLNARAERQHYLDYVSVLILARDTVRADLAREAPAAQALLEAARSGRLAEPAEGWERALREAIRDWRALNRGASLPLPGQSGWPKVRDVLLARMWSMAGMEDEGAMADRAVEHCLGTDRTPLRLSRDGRSRLVLYANRSDAANADVVEMLGSWPYVDRMVLAVARDGSFTEERSREVMPSKAEMATERTVRDFQALVPAPTIMGLRDGAAVRSLLADAVAACAMRCVLASAEPSQEEVDMVRLQARTLVRERSHGHVERQRLVQPAGILVNEGRSLSSGEASHVRVRLVGYCEDAWNWVARHAGPDVRQALMDDVSSSYARPQTHLAALPAHGTQPEHRPIFSWDVSAKGMGEFLDASGRVFMPEDAHCQGHHGVPGKTPRSALEAVQDALGEKSGYFGRAAHTWMSLQAASYLTELPHTPLSAADQEPGGRLPEEGSPLSP
jgi:hypothetical protein